MSKKSKDSSKPVGIEDIIKTGSASIMAEEIHRLQKIIDSQQEYIGNLLNTLQEKESTITALRSGDESAVVHLSDEEIVANTQLRKLKFKAEVGELTLDDVRKYDILVKNLRITKGQPTSVEAEYKNLLESKPTAALLSMASKKRTHE